LINNRQGGRRRGRGGQRGQNLGGQPGGGNRQDNRQRGNAAQLLEKYKSMARDAQLSGDRVQTEYYLQFADHYFRVLSESRARFEDQRRQRGDDDSDEDEGEDELIEAGEESGSDDGDSEQNFERPRRRERNDRGDRGERSERGERQEREPRFAREERPRRERSARNGADRDEDEGIAIDALPPSIGADVSNDTDEAEETTLRPRRRTRRPRNEDGEGEIAPAA
jgi:hypothetical protein